MEAVQGFCFFALLVCPAVSLRTSPNAENEPLGPPDGGPRGARLPVHMLRADSRVEVHQLSGGYVTVLRDPWWVGNRELRLVTVETRPNKTKLPNITNVGEGQPWSGFVTKVGIMDEWLSLQAHDKGLLIFADGEDVVFGGCSEKQFLQDYKDTVRRSGGIKLVIGAERGCSECPVACRDMPEVPTWARRNWNQASGGPTVRSVGADPKGQMRFLNSGFLIGPVEQLAQIFHAALEQMKLHPEHKGDQYAMYKQFLEHPNIAALDYSSSLVTNIYSLDARKLFRLLPYKGLYNRVTKKQQCFVHANGPSSKEFGQLIEWLRGGEAPWWWWLP